LLIFSLFDVVVVISRTVEPVLEPKEKLLEALKNAGKAQSSFPLSLLGETIICE
jgi:hypothetical protein